jgi:hypothetical protein
VSAARQLCLDAGIPVLKKADGTECVKVSEATARYLDSDPVPIFAPLSCSCSQRPYPHDLSAHRKLFESPGTYETFEERIRFAPDGMCWPWSLRFVEARDEI